MALERDEHFAGLVTPHSSLPGELPGLDVARAVARQNGAAAETVHLLATQGVANVTYAVGADTVLRIARAGFEADLATEAALLPLLTDIDVPAPTVLAHNDGPEDDSTPSQPWMLQNRLPGALLATTDLAVPARRRAYRELGQALHRLHTQVPIRAALAAAPQLKTLTEPDPLDTVRKLTMDNWVGPEEASWLTAWFEHLRQWQPDSIEAVLLHGDASPTNVLVEPSTGSLTALLDWGDAFCSDPAVDLAKVPGPHLPAAVAGYAADPDLEVGWAARALWHQLTWALGALSRPPRPGDPTWSAPPAARLLNLMRLLLDVPTTWSPLLPPRT